MLIEKDAKMGEQIDYKSGRVRWLALQEALASAKSKAQVNQEKAASSGPVSGSGNNDYGIKTSFNEETGNKAVTFMGKDGTKYTTITKTDVNGLTVFGRQQGNTNNRNGQNMGPGPGGQPVRDMVPQLKPLGSGSSDNSGGTTSTVLSNAYPKNLKGPGPGSSSFEEHDEVIVVRKIVEGGEVVFEKKTVKKVKENLGVTSLRTEVMRKIYGSDIAAVHELQKKINKSTVTADGLLSTDPNRVRVPELSGISVIGTRSPGVEISGVISGREEVIIEKQNQTQNTKGGFDVNNLKTTTTTTTTTKKIITATRDDKEEEMRQRVAAAMEKTQTVQMGQGQAISQNEMVSTQSTLSEFGASGNTTTKSLSNAKMARIYGADVARDHELIEETGGGHRVIDVDAFVLREKREAEYARQQQGVVSTTSRCPELSGIATVSSGMSGISSNKVTKSTSSSSGPKVPDISPTTTGTTGTKSTGMTATTTTSTQTGKSTTVTFSELPPGYAKSVSLRNSKMAKIYGPEIAANNELVQKREQRVQMGAGGLSVTSVSLGSEASSSTVVGGPGGGTGTGVKLTSYTPPNPSGLYTQSLSTATTGYSTVQTQSESQSRRQSTPSKSSTPTNRSARSPAEATVGSNGTTAGFGGIAGMGSSASYSNTSTPSPSSDASTAQMSMIQIVVPGGAKGIRSALRQKHQSEAERRKLSASPSQ